MLAWAIAGWALASMLGLVLLFQLLSRDEPVEPAPTSNGLPSEEPTLLPAPAAPTEVVSASEPVDGAVAPDDDGVKEAAEEPEADTFTSHAVSEPAPPASKVSADGAIIAAYLRHAAVFTEAGKFDEAIEAYDRALELDPENADFIALRSQVVELRRSGAARRSATRLSFQESRTEYHPASLDAAARFETSGSGLTVARATKAPDFPAELVIDIRPRSVAPGDPYVLRVRLYNKGNRPIEVKSLEIIETIDDETGRGKPLTPLSPRVSPRDTALLWEGRGVWSETGDQGSIEVIVTLSGDARVTKRIWW